MEQQLRWHQTIEYIWGEQDRLNQPSDEYTIVRSFFRVNLDETGVLANEGTVKVIGDSEKRNMRRTWTTHVIQSQLFGWAQLEAPAVLGFFWQLERGWTVMLFKILKRKEHHLFPRFLWHYLRT
jgi:hypothetical protein